MLVLLIPSLAHAQPWSGIIDPLRAIDWSSGNQGVPGGIPNRTFSCATIAPYNGSAATINSAIAACANNASARAAGGGVVNLQAGTFNLTSGIDFTALSNVTVRGAGPDRTRLVFTGHAGCNGYGPSVCFHGSSSFWEGGGVGTVPVQANWTAGFAAGTTQITLSTVAGLAVGQYLILDQLDDATDTGQVYVCADANPPCSLEGGPGARPGRAQQQYVKITAINANVVTITPGIYMPNWRTSQSPQAISWGPNDSRMNGLESVTVDGLANGGRTNIACEDASESWIKNVRSFPGMRNHVWLLTCARFEVRDSYFYGTQNAASESYGLETWASGDHMIVNNIFQHVAVPFLVGNNYGSVFAFNFTTDNYTIQSGGAQMQTGMLIHDAGVGMTLYEGNVTNQIEGDTFHGNSNFMTAFRNVAIGQEPTVVSPAKSNCTVPLNLWSFHRFWNLVGNLFGLTGYHTNYEQDAPPGGWAPSSPEHTVYVLGFVDPCGSPSGEPGAATPNDPLVKTTLFRWGNCDSVHGFTAASCQFNPSEVPTGLAKYANAVPASRTLPASFFLTARPAWWGTPWGVPPWPAIGPDVTGGTLAGVGSASYGGLAYSIPAVLCYTHMSPDPVYSSMSAGETVNDNLAGKPGIFNANTCYTVSSGPAPNPPTSLQVQ